MPTPPRGPRLGAWRRRARPRPRPARRCAAEKQALLRADPGLRDRRGPRDADAVRRPAGDLRRLHRVRAGRWPSSRTSSATRCCPSYANTHTESSGTGLQTTRLREDARADHPRGASAATTTRSCSSPGPGCTGAIAKLIGVLGLRIPSALDDQHALSEHIPPAQRPVVFIGPYEHHSNELPWRESIADVVTIPQDADGDIDQRRPARAAREVRRPAAEDRLVLRRLQRHRHRLRHRRHRDAAARARRAVLLGLRRGGAVRRHRDGRRRPGAARCPTRTRSSSPRTSSSAGRRRRACWSRAASCSPTGCPTCPAAARSPTSTTTTTATSTTRRTARRAARPRSSSRSAPAWSSSSSRPSASTRSARQEERHLRRAVGGLARGAGASSCSATSTPSGSRSCRSWCARRRAATCTTTTSSRCSTTCSASSRAAAARAPAPTATGCSASTSSAPTSSSARSPAAARASSPGWVRVNFNYFLSDAVADYLVEAVRLVARDGWRLLGDYRFDTATGLWRHRDGLVEPPLQPARRLVRRRAGLDAAPHRGDRGRGAAGRAPPRRRARSWPPPTGPDLARHPGSVSADFEHLRWFDLPRAAIVPVESARLSPGRGGSAAGAGLQLTSILPVLPPRSRSRNASTAWSSPSTTVSRNCRLPSGDPGAGALVELAGQVGVVGDDEAAQGEPLAHDHHHVARARGRAARRCTAAIAPHSATRPWSLQRGTIAASRWSPPTLSK